MSLVGFKAQNHPQQKAKPQVDDRATCGDLGEMWCSDVGCEEHR